MLLNTKGKLTKVVARQSPEELIAGACCSAKADGGIGQLSNCKSRSQSLHALATPRRSLGYFLALLFLLTVVSAGTALANGTDVPAQEEASSFIPGWTSQAAQEQAVEESEPANSAPPATNPEAAETLPHDDLGRAEASELLTAVFGEVLNEANGIFDNLEVEQFHSNYVAVVGGSDAPASELGEPGLLTSLLPLRVKNSQGELAPVDLDLYQVDGELSPKNPLAEVGIPNEIGEGISLTKSGVTLNLVDAPDDRAASDVHGSAAFYPNVAPDSDLTVLPTPTGVETSTVLRTPDAPLTQTYDLTLPPRAHLVTSTEHGASIVRDGETLVAIRPPTAIDAEGSPVPVALEIDGTSIIIRAAPEQENLYPILVDPIYETYFWDQYPNSDGPEWVANSSPCLVAGWSFWGLSGLSMYSCSNAWVTAGSQATWNYYVPRFFTDMSDPLVKERPTTYIKQMTMTHLTFTLGEGAPAYDDPHLTMGLWSERYSHWVSVTSQNGGEGPLTNTAYPWTFQNPDEVEDAKNGGIALASFVPFMHGQRNVMIGQATVEISDKDVPNIGKLGAAGSWVNQQATSPINYVVVDRGLGVYQMRVAQPRASGGISTVTTSAECLGSARSACPRTLEASQRALKYEPQSMPQGENWIKVSAVDPILHESVKKDSLVKVDHTPPRVSLSGTLTEQAKVGTSAAQYGLSYSASDGDDQAATPLPSIGGAGTAEGKTQRPMGVALDSSGNVWVIDRENSRVEKFDPTGNFLFQFGSFGTGNGQFNDPRALTISPNGNIWVSEIGNRRVQQFKPNGEFVSKIVLPATSEPYGIALGSDGVLWIADTYNHKVYKYSEAGVLLGEARGSATDLAATAPAGTSPLSGPIGLTTDAGGNVWVVDNATSRLTKFDATGKFVTQFGVTGVGDGQLSGPAFAAVAPSGNILVSDSGNNRIQVFQPSGDFLRRFGTVGPGSEQLFEPRGIIVDANGNAYIADAGNHRIVPWSHADLDPQSGITKVEVKVDSEAPKVLYNAACPVRDCNATDEWPFEASKYSNGPHTVEVTATDGVGLKTTRTQAITLNHDSTAPSIGLSGSMTEQGTLGTTLPRYTLSYSAFDNSPQGGSLVPAFSVGSAGSGSGQLNRSADVAFDAKGNFWVADEGNNRIEKFSAAGGYLGKVGSAGPANGQFIRPTALAIDSKGNIWIADAGNCRIQKFSESGAFLAKVGSCGTGTGAFGSPGPEGIAVAPTGNIWVSDTANGRLEVFSESAVFLKTVGIKGTGTAQSGSAPQLGEPKGIAIGPGGYAYVADSSNNRFAMINGEGGFAGQFGTKGTGNGQFERPSGIERDAKGNIWVVDQLNGRVQQFNTNMEYVSQIGAKGSGSGQFAFGSSAGIAGDLSGNMWIADTNNNRIQKWSPLGGVQSGVASATVKVDGKVVDSTSPGCSTGNCELGRVWNLNSTAYEAKQHVVEVTATDAFGLSSTKTLTINIAKDNKSPQLTATKTLYTAPEGWVEQKVMPYEATATDVGGYGLTSIALKIDGAVVKDVSQTCLAGSCAISLGSGSVDLSGYDGGSHPAELVAIDGAGNVAKKTWTINVDPKGTITTGEAEDTLEAAEDTGGVNLIGDPKEEEEYEGTTSYLGVQQVGVKASATGVAVPVSINSAAAGGGLTLKVPPKEDLGIPCGETDGSEFDKELEEAGEVPVHDDPPATCVPPSLIPGAEGNIPVQITPLGTGPAATPGVVSGKAAVVAANSITHVDTVVKPIYDGAMIFQLLRDSSAPETFSWRVDMEPGQTLKLIDEQHAAVYYADGIHSSVSITAEPAHDAVGTAVPSKISVSGNDTVTLSVMHHASNFVYPVAAGPGWSGGFHTYSILKPPPEVGDEAEEEPSEVEVVESNIVVRSAVIGAPVIRGTVPLSGLGPNPEVTRPFKFNDCAYKGEPTPETFRKAKWDCHHNLEGEKVKFATLVNGYFHYRYDEKVWLNADEWGCHHWAKAAEVDCWLWTETLYDPKGPIIPIGYFRIPPGGWSYLLATCNIVGGILTATPPKVDEFPYSWAIYKPSFNFRRLVPINSAPCKFDDYLPEVHTTGGTTYPFR